MNEYLSDNRDVPPFFAMPRQRLAGLLDREPFSYEAVKSRLEENFAYSRPEPMQCAIIAAALPHLDEMVQALATHRAEDFIWYDGENTSLQEALEMWPAEDAALRLYDGYYDFDATEYGHIIEIEHEETMQDYDPVDDADRIKAINKGLARRKAAAANPLAHPRLHGYFWEDADEYVIWEAFDKLGRIDANDSIRMANPLDPIAQKIYKTILQNHWSADDVVLTWASSIDRYLPAESYHPHHFAAAVARQIDLALNEFVCSAYSLSDSWLRATSERIEAYWALSTRAGNTDWRARYMPDQCSKAAERILKEHADVLTWKTWFYDIIFARNPEQIEILKRNAYDAALLTLTAIEGAWEDVSSNLDDEPDIWLTGSRLHFRWGEEVYNHSFLPACPALLPHLIKEIAELMARYVELTRLTRGRFAELDSVGMMTAPNFPPWSEASTEIGAYIVRTFEPVKGRMRNMMPIMQVNKYRTPDGWTYSYNRDEGLERLVAPSFDLIKDLPGIDEWNLAHIDGPIDASRPVTRLVRLASPPPEFDLDPILSWSRMADLPRLPEEPLGESASGT